MKAGVRCVTLMQWLQLKRAGGCDKIADLPGRVGSSVMWRYRESETSRVL